MLRKKAIWNIVLEGDEVDTIDIVRYIEENYPKLRLRRADASISWFEENDPQNPKSDTPKK